jgi:hypothetical protein
MIQESLSCPTNTITFAIERALNNAAPYCREFLTEQIAPQNIKYEIIGDTLHLILTDIGADIATLEQDLWEHELYQCRYAKQLGEILGGE